MKILRKTASGMPLRQDPKNSALGTKRPASLSDVKNLRYVQKDDVNERIEALKTKLFRLTEHHMDHAINILRKWLDKRR